MIACPYCKSPSPGRPCWYFDDNPDRLPSGGDPPCMLYGDDLWDQDAQARRREKKRQRTRAIVIVALLIGAGILLYALPR